MSLLGCLAHVDSLDWLIWVSQLGSLLRIRLVDWLVDRLIDWVTDRSIDWSLDWLIDWNNFFCTLQVIGPLAITSKKKPVPWPSICSQTYTNSRKMHSLSPTLSGIWNWAWARTLNAGKYGARLAWRKIGSFPSGWRIIFGPWAQRARAVRAPKSITRLVAIRVRCWSCGIWSLCSSIGRGEAFWSRCRRSTSIREWDWKRIVAFCRGKRQIMIRICLCRSCIGLKR